MPTARGPLPLTEFSPIKKPALWATPQSNDGRAQDEEECQHGQSRAAVRPRGGAPPLAGELLANVRRGHEQAPPIPPRKGAGTVDTAASSSVGATLLHAGQHVGRKNNMISPKRPLVLADYCSLQDEQAGEISCTSHIAHDNVVKMDHSLSQEAAVSGDEESCTADEHRGGKRTNLGASREDIEDASASQHFTVFEEQSYSYEHIHGGTSSCELDNSTLSRSSDPAQRKRAYTPGVSELGVHLQQSPQKPSPKQRPMGSMIIATGNSGRKHQGSNPIIATSRPLPPGSGQQHIRTGSEVVLSTRKRVNLGDVQQHIKSATKLGIDMHDVPADTPGLPNCRTSIRGSGPAFQQATRASQNKRKEQTDAGGTRSAPSRFLRAPRIRAPSATLRSRTNTANSTEGDNSNNMNYMLMNNHNPQTTTSEIASASTTFAPGPRGPPSAVSITSGATAGGASSPSSSSSANATANAADRMEVPSAIERVPELEAQLDILLTNAEQDLLQRRRLEESVRVLTESVDSLTQEKSAAQRKLQMLERTNTKLARGKAAEAAARSDRDREVEDLKAEVVKAKELVTDRLSTRATDAALSESKEEIAHLQERLGLSDRQRAELADQVSTLEIEKDDLLTANDLLEQGKLTLAEDARRQVDEAAMREEEVNAEKQSLETKIASLTAEIEAQKKLIEEIEQHSLERIARLQRENEKIIKDFTAELEGEVSRREKQEREHADALRSAEDAAFQKGVQQATAKNFKPSSLAKPKSVVSSKGRSASPTKQQPTESNTTSTSSSKIVDEGVFVARFKAALQEVLSKRATVGVAGIDLDFPVALSEALSSSLVVGDGSNKKQASSITELVTTLMSAFTAHLEHVVEKESRLASNIKASNTTSPTRDQALLVQSTDSTTTASTASSSSTSSSASSGRALQRAIETMYNGKIHNGKMYNGKHCDLSALGGTEDEASDVDVQTLVNFLRERRNEQEKHHKQLKALRQLACTHVVCMKSLVKRVHRALRQPTSAAGGGGILDGNSPKSPSRRGNATATATTAEEAQEHSASSGFRDAHTKSVDPNTFYSPAKSCRAVSPSGTPQSGTSQNASNGTFNVSASSAVASIDEEQIRAIVSEVDMSLKNFHAEIDNVLEHEALACARKQQELLEKVRAVCSPHADPIG
ncbi:unnamed protein product [Amoebophrya sp. A25]|nr:unnamed protein product [Amoebophrya sp. A25]|eukprot:GSA25T00012766001.1